MDVAAAQTALCLITWATLRLRCPGRTNRLGRLAWVTTATVIALHLLGIVVAGPGPLVRCLGWPVWRIVGTDGSPLLQWVRPILGLAAAVLLVVVVREDPPEAAPEGRGACAALDRRARHGPAHRRPVHR